MDWLLLRGLARQSEHWGDFPYRLRQAFPDDGVHALDLPGTGVRCGETSPTSISAIRECVQQQAENLPGPLILVGLSMGGMVALDWANSQPAGVAGVVAINSSSAWNRPWHRMKFSQWRTVLGLLAHSDSKRRESEILALTTNRRHPEQVLAHWVQLQDRFPVTRKTAIRQIQAAARYRPAIDPPRVPTLLVASRKDRLVSHRCSKTLAQLWGSKLVQHDWAGHDLPLDDPAWLIDQLRNFRRHRIV